MEGRPRCGEGDAEFGPAVGVVGGVGMSAVGGGEGGDDGQQVAAEGHTEHAVQAGGLQQTALHKHLLEQSPPIWWTHIAGHGDAADLARAVRSALDATDTPPPASATSGQTSLDLDTAAIDEALGRSGTIAGGVYKFFIARRDPVTMSGMLIPPSMGLATALNFQPTGNGRAAINGDFVMTAAEVQDVVQALRGGGIDIVAIHNHGFDEQPRLFYMHFWAENDAVALARTLRAAVDVVMQASCDDVLVQWAMFGRDPRHGTVAWNASATVATLCRVEPGLPTVAR
ncbi:lipoprotein lpqo [Mycobacterium tuberculosis]|nr:lipoprotein lpqo [Mycobacterium tuberculosis]